jgi:phage FluMu protein Com
MIAVAERIEIWRCCHCGRILAKLVLAPGSRIEIKCKCNAMNVREAL